MGVSYVKFCPRCQATAAVDAALCPNCGHQFRTHFQPPISEKTIAMTSIPASERPPGAARTSPEDKAYRPTFRPRRILLGAVVLAIAGLVYGTLSRRAHEAASGPARPAPIQAFRPYPVMITGAGGASAPFATQSAADLQQWDASQTRPAGAGDAAAGDSPAHVHLYLSKRVLLVAAGTPARVLLEQGTWRRVQILAGSYQGRAGYVSQNHVRPVPLAPHP